MPPTGSGGGYGGDDKVVYWKCEVGQILQENLSIPMKNLSRERALIHAARNVRQPHSKHFAFLTFSYMYKPSVCSCLLTDLLH